MAINIDWVEGVRRWYYGGNAPAADRTRDAQASINDPAVPDYEATQPALWNLHLFDTPQSPSGNSL